MRAFGATLGRTRRCAAPPALTALLSSLGASGLAAAASRPWLLASIDQHAAAVRDNLAGLTAGAPGRPLAPRPDLLAAYADGVRAAAYEQGWRPPSGPVDWSEPDWVSLRLLAVCALARAAGIRG